MKLSVIIPAYDDLPGVMTALNSLQATASTGHQYLVQDDASPAVNFVATVPASIADVQRNDQNLGFGGNCNAAALRGANDILFFVNQDVYAVPELSAGWDQRLLSAFNDSTVGIVGPKLLFPDGRIQSAGGFFDARKQPYHRCLGYSDHTFAEINTPMLVGWVTGAAFAIRRDLFRALGGFDPIYGRGYFEDVDLCAKAAIRQFSIWYQPDAILIHRVGGTGGNPRILENARKFRDRWSQFIEPDTTAVYESFW